MALDLAPSPIPLLAGAVVTMILGAVWYGIFAKPWMAMAHPGRSREEINEGPKWPYAFAALAAIALSYAFGVGSESADLDLAGNLLAAAIVALPLVAMYLTTYAFAYKPLKLALIDVGYFVLSLFALALLYGLL